MIIIQFICLIYCCLNNCSANIFSHERTFLVYWPLVIWKSVILNCYLVPNKFSYTLVLSGSYLLLNNALIILPLDNFPVLPKVYICPKRINQQGSTKRYMHTFKILNQLYTRHLVWQTFEYFFTWFHPRKMFSQFYARFAGGAMQGFQLLDRFDHNSGESPDNFI